MGTPAPRTDHDRRDAAGRGDCRRPVEATDAGTETGRSAAAASRHSTSGGRRGRRPQVRRCCAPVRSPGSRRRPRWAWAPSWTVRPLAGAGDVRRAAELVSAGTPNYKAGQIYESECRCMPPRCGARGPAARRKSPLDPATTSPNSAAVLEGHRGQADLIVTTGGPAPARTRWSKTPLGGDSNAVSPGPCRARDAAGRRRHQTGARHHHAARQPGQRAGVLRGVLRACRCAPRWNCPAAAAGGLHPVPPSPDIAPGGQTPVPSGVPGGTTVTTTAAGVASSALAGVGELPALEIPEDVTGIAGRKRPSVWICGHLESRRWPDAPARPDDTNKSDPQTCRR